MTGLVFAQQVNLEGRSDASTVFVPGARAFALKHGLGTPIWLDDRDDRNLIVDTIASASGLQAIAYFGHGTTHGLPSADIGRRHVAGLTAAVRRAAAPGCRFILYACSAGATGGLAQTMATDFGGRVKVYGHTTPGHGYFNPNVTHYPYTPLLSPFLIPPNSELWTAWCRALRRPGSDLWMRFPFMQVTALEDELRSGAGRVRTPSRH